MISKLTSEHIRHMGFCKDSHKTGTNFQENFWGTHLFSDQFPAARWQASSRWRQAYMSARGNRRWLLQKQSMGHHYDTIPTLASLAESKTTFVRLWKNTGAEKAWLKQFMVAWGPDGPGLGLQLLHSIGTEGRMIKTENYFFYMSRWTSKFFYCEFK